jgi:hypothetical protein
MLLIFVCPILVYYVYANQKLNVLFKKNENQHLKKPLFLKARLVANENL